MVTIALGNLGVALGRRSVVKEASATFAPGTLTGIVGPNGAGKSTLARAMLALVPATGAVHIDGIDAAAMPRADLARRIAYLPQGQTLHWPLVPVSPTWPRLQHTPFGQGVAAGHSASTGHCRHAAYCIADGRSVKSLTPTHSPAERS